MEACQGVDNVLHHAAWGSVPRSIELPLLFEEINIKGTLNMLEAARQNVVKKLPPVPLFTGMTRTCPKKKDRKRMLCKALGKNIEPILGKGRKGDMKHSNADISKAKELLG